MGGRSLRCSKVNHPECSFGPGFQSVFYTYRLACLVEAVNDKHQTSEGRFTMFVYTVHVYTVYMQCMHCSLYHFSIA